MPYFPLCLGFWASCVPGELELIIYLLDSFPECSLPAKQFAKMALRDYSTLPRGMDVNVPIV